MQAVDEKIETIHLYVVREQPKQPSTALPSFGALLCILFIAGVTLYSAQHPVYQHERLTVPAIFLPSKVFTARAPIIPTGETSYPATTAHGRLTLTNGSVLSETLPAGIIFSGVNGAEVQTTASAFIPAGSASGYGITSVPARAVVIGKSGNIPILAVNAVYGTALYVRNLSAFSGGKDSYTVTVATVQDRVTALQQARSLLTSRSSGLRYPCKELYRAAADIEVTWHCRFVSYHVPSYMHVNAVRLSGNNLLIDVVFIARPMLVRTRFGVGR